MTEKRLEKRWQNWLLETKAQKQVRAIRPLNTCKAKDADIFFEQPQNKEQQNIEVKNFLLFL